LQVAGVERGVEDASGVEACLVGWQVFERDPGARLDQRTSVRLPSTLVAPSRMPLPVQALSSARCQPSYSSS
jgi:hypothetical protein